MAERETVAALAAQVASVRDDQTATQEAVDELRTALATFQARLDTETGPVMVLQSGHKRLREQLDALQQQVEKLAAALAQPGDSDEDDAGPVVLRWDTGTTEELNARLDEMRGWVGNVLRRQYPGPAGVLKKCWPSHMEVLWELSALKAEYERVFGPEELALADVQWWHERWLPGWRNRIREDMHGCDGTRCTARPAKTRTGPAAQTPPRARSSDPVSAAFKDIPPRRPY